MSPEKQGSDWRFWAAVPVVGIVLCAGLIGFHRYTHLGRGLSVDGLAMVGTTLVAAAAGFLAILYQVRSGSRQLREQLADQQRTSAAEAERQRHAVGRAILFEIDSIYRSSIRDTCETLQNAAGREFAVKPHSFHFTVYEGNASKIGELPAELGQDIVGFYGSATRMLTTLQMYSEAVRNAHEPRGNIDWKAMASQYYEQTVKTAPYVRLLCYLVSRRLCEYTSYEFAVPAIAVAAENPKDLQGLIDEVEASRRATNR